MPVIWVKVPKYQCSRCDYEWFPKNLKDPGDPPRECSHCHNSYWNQPRVYKRKTITKRRDRKASDEEVKSKPTETVQGESGKSKKGTTTK